MQRYKNQKLRRICLGGLLAALSIVFGKLLAFNIGETFRVSLENLPIILAGITLGPIYGAMIGLVADLAGCLMVGYTINPIITVGAMTVGFVSGLIFRVTKGQGKGRIALSVIAAHLCGSLLIKTAGLSAFYGTDYFSLFFYRLINYLPIAALESIIVYILIKNKEIGKILSKFEGEEK
jgi:ECF transporter S component (folate family)